MAAARRAIAAAGVALVAAAPGATLQGLTAWEMRAVWPDAA